MANGARSASQDSSRRADPPSPRTRLRDSRPDPPRRPLSASPRRWPCRRPAERSSRPIPRPVGTPGGRKVIGSASVHSFATLKAHAMVSSVTFCAPGVAMTGDSTTGTATKTTTTGARASAPESLHARSPSPIGARRGGAYGVPSGDTAVVGAGPPQHGDPLAGIGAPRREDPAPGERLPVLGDLGVQQRVRASPGADGAARRSGRGLGAPSPSWSTAIRTRGVASAVSPGAGHVDLHGQVQR